MREKMINKCLIVGGNGFIGRNLIARLLKEAHEIVVFDNSKPIAAEDGVQYIQGNIDDTDRLVGETLKADAVIWLVHTSVPATSMDDVESDLMSNVSPLIRFLLKLPKEKEKKFIYLSSGGTVYGDIAYGSKVSENAPKDPISSYGLTKLIAEEYITFLLKRSAISTFILRPSNVYGRYQNLTKPQGIIGHVFNAILSDKPIVIFGNGTITRDYVHVIDLTELMIACLNSQVKSSHPVVLNVGSGKPITINEIINLASKISGESIAIDKMPERSFDCLYNVLSIDKARTTMGWEPRIELEDGLIDVWSWIKDEVRRQ